MNIFALTCFVTGTLAGFTGFFVFIKGARQRLNQLWFIFNLSIAVWLVGLGGTLIVDNPASGLIWQRALYIGTIFIPFLFLHFCTILTEKKYDNLFRINAILAVFFTIVLFIGNLFIKGMKSKTSFGYWPVETGLLYYPFLFWYGVNVIYGFVLMKRKLIGKDLDFIKKKQLSIIFYGTMIGFIAGSVNFLLDFNIIFPPFHNFFVSGYLIFTALAIARYNLFEIRVLLTEILVGATAITIFIQAFTAETLLLKVLGFLLFILFLGFGYTLVRSVIREIELRAELQVAYAELKKMDKAKTEFLSIASHQLRTPLGIIKGYISMILESSYGKIPKDIKQPLENVYTSNNGLLKLVDDLLDVSKIEMGKMELELVEVLVEDIILEIVTGLNLKAKEKKLYLKFEKPKTASPKVTIDREKIKNVIMNVIDNAIKYTKQGGVTVKCKIVDGKLQIEVKDTGPGMEKDELENIFKPLARGTAGLKQGGAGLGLYVARKFVEAHGGKIWAQSEGKSKGSIFIIELPLK